MENSTIFGLIEGAYFEKWQDEIRKADEVGYLKTMLESRKNLKEKFSEEQFKIIDEYAVKVENYYEDKFYEMCLKMLNLCIRIGIDVQKIISED